MIIKNLQKNKGFILASTLVFSVIATIIIIALTSWFAIVFKSVSNLTLKEQALHLAESGVEYYRWHLAHDSQDFFDGNGSSTGPYVHQIKDNAGQVIGSFSLKIIAPNDFSNFVILESTGQIADRPDLIKTIRVKFAKSSLAKFAFVSDSDMRFGENTEVFGPIHSNGGIRFDGLAHNLVTSAREQYDDPDHSGNEEFGVHTHVEPADPLPPSAVPIRSDIFVAGRQFPVPAVDFNGLTNDLSNLKNLAEEKGVYLPESGALGYLIILKENDTFDLYKVTSLEDIPQSSCQNYLNQEEWGTWSVKNIEFLSNYNFPSNGIIFAEDNIWVEGKINSARLTISVGKFPDLVSTRKSITVNHNLLYTKYDGQDVISLIAQKNINTGLMSDNELRIDAALVAQNGRVGRYYYNNLCGSNYTKNSLTLYGMIATKNRYGYAYSDNTGYSNRTIIYDSHLLYNPPPHFPIIGGNYEIVSWEEVI